MIRNKTKSVLGVVSNCNSGSGREEMIENLRKYVDITLQYIALNFHLNQYFPVGVATVI